MPVDTPVEGPIPVITKVMVEPMEHFPWSDSFMWDGFTGDIGMGDIEKTLCSVIGSNPLNMACASLPVGMYLAVLVIACGVTFPKANAKYLADQIVNAFPVPVDAHVRTLVACFYALPVSRQLSYRGNDALEEFLQRQFGLTAKGVCEQVPGHPNLNWIKIPFEQFPQAVAARVGVLHMGSVYLPAADMDPFGENYTAVLGTVIQWARDCVQSVVQTNLERIIGRYSADELPDQVRLVAQAIGPLVLRCVEMTEGVDPDKSAQPPPCVLRAINHSDLLVNQARVFLGGFIRNTGRFDLIHRLPAKTDKEKERKRQTVSACHCRKAYSVSCKWVASNTGLCLFNGSGRCTNLPDSDLGGWASTPLTVYRRSNDTRRRRGSASSNSAANRQRPAETRKHSEMH